MDSSLSSNLSDIQISEPNPRKNDSEDSKPVHQCTITLLFPDWLCLFWTGWLEITGRGAVTILVGIAAALPFIIVSLLHEAEEARNISKMCLMFIISIVLGVVGSEIFLKSAPIVSANHLNKMSKVSSSEDSLSRYLGSHFKDILMADRASEKRNIVTMGVNICWIGVFFAIASGFMFSQSHGGEGTIQIQTDNKMKDIQSSCFAMMLWLVTSGMLWCFASKYTNDSAGNFGNIANNTKK